MKNFFKAAAVIAIALVSNSAMAQTTDYEEPKNEFSISYGAGPITQYFDNLGNALGTAFTGGGCIGDDQNYGVINLDYTRHVTKWLAIGGNFSLSANQTTYYEGIRQKQTDGSYLVYKGAKMGEDNMVNLTVMPTLKFNWFRREHVSLYSRVSAGVTVQCEATDSKTSSVPDEDRTVVHFNGQLSPIGVEAGGNHVRAFAEVGVGQCGIAQGGIRFRF